MPKWGELLLPLGLVCPLVSWLTVIYGLLRARTERGYSAVLIPIVGPTLLTAFVIVEGHPSWVIPIVWVLDIGTVAFVAVLPALFVDWWTYSKFTQLVSMQGHSGHEQVHLTLHKSKRYCLKKSWNRRDLGIIGLGESGHFSVAEDGVVLIADFGLYRHLKQTGPTTYSVQEKGKQAPERRNHSIDGWTLTPDREFQV